MKIETAIGHATKHRIVLRGEDLVDEIIDRRDFVDVFVRAITGRYPDANFKRMSNAILVALLDHGFTPSSVAARLTLLGAPESMQGAVAAGLLGAGSHFLGTMELTANMLIEALSHVDDGAEIPAVAAEVVTRFRREKRAIPGIGHPIHTDGDPRVPKLRQVAAECGYDGRHCQLVAAIAAEASGRVGKRLPLNAAGLVGAIICDMGCEPGYGKALALIGRTAGLMAHLLEEQATPVAQSVWDLVLREEQAGAAGADKP